MKVDWVHTPMYNTVMSVAAGVGLLLLVMLGRSLYSRRPFSAEGYAVAFGALGLVLFPMGLHMSLTWPLARIAPFDNIMFGETSVAFGAMLLAASAYLWRRGAALEPAGPADEAAEEAQARLEGLARLALPISLFAAGMGLACFAIAAAGWRYTLWAAPPQEPISGQFANHPLLEATFISLLYVGVGAGAVLLPLVLLTRRKEIAFLIGLAWTLAGLGFTIFGALNFFTHTGLIIHTS
jgi:uncharacterized membrane protein